MGKSNSKANLCNGIKLNDEKLLNAILSTSPNLFKEFINENNDHTALCMAAYYGSLKAVELLVEGGADVNQVEVKDNNSPLLIAAKRNKLDVLKYLLEKGADVNYRNKMDLSVLDYAVIHSNYDIAYHIETNYPESQPKTLDEYIDLSRDLRVPLFNIVSFMENLKEKVEPSKVPSFGLSNEEKTSNSYFFNKF